MLPILDVVAAVIVDQGLYLACRRRPGLASEGLWEFPGGKIEVGETPTEALIREIREELGCDIEVLHELWRDETPQGERAIRLICMQAKLTGPLPTRSVDHDEMKWLSPAELVDLRWAEPDLPAVSRLAKNN